MLETYLHALGMLADEPRADDDGGRVTLSRSHRHRFRLSTGTLNIGWRVCPSASGQSPAWPSSFTSCSLLSDLCSAHRRFRQIDSLAHVVTRRRQRAASHSEWRLPRASVCALPRRSSVLPQSHAHYAPGSSSTQASSPCPYCATDIRFAATRDLLRRSPRCSWPPCRLPARRQAQEPTGAPDGSRMPSAAGPAGSIALCSECRCRSEAGGADGGPSAGFGAPGSRRRAGTEIAQRVLELLIARYPDSASAGRSARRALRALRQPTASDQRPRPRLAPRGARPPARSAESPPPRPTAEPRAEHAPIGDRAGAPASSASAACRTTCATASATACSSAPAAPISAAAPAPCIAAQAEWLLRRPGGRGHRRGPCRRCDGRRRRRRVWPTRAQPPSAIGWSPKASRPAAFASSPQGARDPVAICGDSDCAAQNRRAVVQVGVRGSQARRNPTEPARPPTGRWTSTVDKAGEPHNRCRLGGQKHSCHGRSSPVRSGGTDPTAGSSTSVRAAAAGDERRDDARHDARHDACAHERCVTPAARRHWRSTFASAVLSAACALGCGLGADRRCPGARHTAMAARAAGGADASLPASKQQPKRPPGARRQRPAARRPRCGSASSSSRSSWSICRSWSAQWNRWPAPAAPRRRRRPIAAACRSAAAGCRAPMPAGSPRWRPRCRR